MLPKEKHLSILFCFNILLRLIFCELYSGIELCDPVHLFFSLPLPPNHFLSPFVDVKVQGHPGAMAESSTAVLWDFEQIFTLNFKKCMIPSPLLNVENYRHTIVK